ncbi:MAG: 30S ribosomal protein S18 [Candidatus Omnitrophota bacterium]
MKPIIRQETRFKRKKDDFKSKKKSDIAGPVRKKFCRFCIDEKSTPIDYKDVKRLERFITERGKMSSRRSSGNCAKHQRKIAEAVKRARFLALLP